MKVIEIERGKKFGKLTLTGESEIKGKHRYVETICECKNIKWIRFDGIKSGAVSSCGCYHSECARKNMTTHGLSGHYLYTTYEDMKARCYNKLSPSYADYGLRGITVCDEWRGDFKAFYDWCLGNGWSKGNGLTLDRIDNDGPYTPNNCRFSSDHVQSRNKRSNVVISAFGEVKCMIDWSNDQRCPVEYKTLSTRIKRGWDKEKAILTPSLIPENKRTRLSRLPGN